MHKKFGAHFCYGVLWSVEAENFHRNDERTGNGVQGMNANNVETGKLVKESEASSDFNVQGISQAWWKDYDMQPMILQSTARSLVFLPNLPSC